MAQGALDLLTRWMEENVRAVPSDDLRSEAMRLVGEFKAYARDVDLSDADLEELEEDLAETLVSHMEDAVRAASASNDNSASG
jgi:hypothetical protein